MRAFITLTFLVFAASLYAADATASTTSVTTKDQSSVPTIGIGGDETDEHTHLLFAGIVKGSKIIKVSTHLTVEKVASNGLNFFAIQVNFPNKTWAHGGPQFNDGKKELANWGGLVSRGGGSKDYTEIDWKNDLLLIECGVGKSNTGPWKWARGVEYVLTVERGQKVVLPAGLNAKHNVEVPERTMWEWKFTIVPVVKSSEPFSALIYDSSDHIGSFCLWNESGYGSTSKDQHSLWSLPTYLIEGGTEELTPLRWKRF